MKVCLSLLSGCGELPGEGTGAGGGAPGAAAATPGSDFPAEQRGRRRDSYPDCPQQHPGD